MILLVRQWFRDLSIKRKLILLMLLACFVTVTATSLAFLFQGINQINQDQLRKMDTLAEVIASNVAAALTFGDPLAAEETMSALSKQKDIISAYLIDDNGHVFVRYLKAGATVYPEPAGYGKAGTRVLQKHEAALLATGQCFDSSCDFVSVLRPVSLDGKVIGQLLVCSDRSRVTAEVNKITMIALLIMVAVFTCAILVSARLQRVISTPILSLAEAMRTVSESKNYALRVNRPSKDEIGLLHTEFNEMLEALEARDKALHENQLELQNKNAELERFTYTVSHDLKSPLITIQGFAGFLQKRLSGSADEEAREDLAHICSAADKMYKLLNDLLELSRVGRMHNPTPGVDLNEVTLEAIRSLEGARQRRSVDIKIAEPLPTLCGDRMRLREVMQNLVENSIKYMGKQQAPLIEVGVADSPHGRACYVKDNGQGIPVQYHEKVFGLFERLDAATEGTGIGLALVKRIIESHGGQIWIESAGDDNGSVFWFTLPWEDVAG